MTPPCPTCRRPLDQVGDERYRCAPCSVRYTARTLEIGSAAERADPEPRVPAQKHGIELVTGLAGDPGPLFSGPWGHC